MIHRLLPIFLVAGCSFYGLDDAQNAEADPSDLDTDTVNESPDSDEADSEIPEYWSIDALWALENGSVVMESSAITIGYWTSTPSLLCEQTYALASVDALPAPTEIPAFGWWQLTVEPSASEDDTDDETDVAGNCDGLPPQPFQFGIGAYDAQLAPALNDEGLPVGEGYLYATYAEADGWSSPFVFGIAGTSANLEGEEGVIVEGTLPDGVYHAIGLYLLPL